MELRQNSSVFGRGRLAWVERVESKIIKKEHLKGDEVKRARVKKRKGGLHAINLACFGTNGLNKGDREGKATI